MSPSLSGSGYLQVSLCKNGVRKTYQVHRLVAENFIDNVSQLPEVNHIDECKTNNRLDNLEFCTRSYNQTYGTRIDRCVAHHNYKESAVKSANNHNYDDIAAKRSIPIEQCDMDGNTIATWRSLRDASRKLGISAGLISGVCNGKLPHTHGYIFNFLTKEV